MPPAGQGHAARVEPTTAPNPDRPSTQVIRNCISTLRSTYRQTVSQLCEIFESNAEAGELESAKQELEDTRRTSDARFKLAEDRMKAMTDGQR